MRKTLTLAAVAVLWTGMAQADAFTDSIVANMRDLGYDFIEIQDGVTQTKVEAVRGTEKLEVVYDRATGRILKQERERAEAGEVGRSGVQIRNRNRDFVEASLLTPVDEALNGQIVDELRAEGYDFIEIKNGPTQIKVEAVRGTEKLEMIVDRDTGAVLKREVEQATARDMGRTGVQIATRSRDFVRVRGDDDDRGRGRGRGGDRDRSSRDDDRDDDRSGRGSGRDDDRDNDRDDDRSSSNSGSGKSGKDGRDDDD